MAAGRTLFSRRTKRLASNTVVATGVIAGTLLCGNPGVGAIVANVSQGLLTGLAERGIRQVHQHFIPTSLLQDDLAEAMRRAYGQALGQLEALWSESGRGKVSGDNPELVSIVFEALREDAEEFLASDAIAAALADPLTIGALGDDAEDAPVAWGAYLTARLEGYSTYLQAFIRTNLLEEVKYFFGEELTKDEPGSNRAWRIYQRLALDGLRASTSGMAEHQDALATRIEAWETRLGSLQDDVRDRTGEEALKAVIAEARDEVIRAIQMEAQATRADVARMFADTRDAARTQADRVIAAIRLESYYSVAEQLQKARSELASIGPDHREFYNGSQPGWIDIVANLDAPRKVTEQVIDFALRHRENPVGVPLALVHALSGDGKTTAAMRIAATLVENGLTVFWHDPASNSLNWQGVADASENEPVVVCIDDAQRIDGDHLEAFLAGLHQVHARVIVLLFARRNLWFADEPVVDTVARVETFPFDDLDDDEIVHILEKLESASELGKLQHLSPDERIARFRETGERQLLIALMEAKHQTGFTQIVRRGIRDIRTKLGAEVERACYIVAALHTFQIECPPTILERMVGVHSLQADILSKTEGLLVPEKGASGLRMRHATFAATVFRLDSGKYDRLRSYIREAAAASPRDPAAGAGEPHVVVQLMRNIGLQARSLDLDHDQVRSLFEVSTSRLDPVPAMLYGLWAQFERQNGYLDDAGRLFQEGAAVDPLNTYPLLAWASFEKEQRRPDMARELYQRATEMNPDASPIWLAWASLEKDQRRFDEARDLYRRGLDANPRNTTGWLAWASFEKEQRRFDEARGLYRRAAEVNPQDTYTLLAWASFEKERRRFDEARGLYRRAAEVNPLDGESRRLWAIMEKDRGNIDEARELFREATATKSALRRAVAWQSWGIMEKEQGEFEEARRLFQLAAGADLSQSDAWLAWATMEKERGDTVRARELYGKATEAKPLDTNIWLAWARMERERGDLDAARRLCQRATEANPDNGDCWRFWATVEKERGEIDEARRLFQKAADANPKDEACWRNWAIMEKEQRDFDRSRSLFERAVDLAPRSVPSWQAWAIMEKERGDIPEARRLFQKATEVNPRQSVFAWQAWAVMEKEQGEIAEAQRLFEMAVEVDPKSSASWQAWGIMAREQGNYRKARRLFQEDAKANPRSSYSYQPWAIMEKELGRIDFARELFQKAIDVNPLNSHAHQAWGLLEKEQGNFDEARRHFRAAAEANATNSAAWQAWALLELEAGDIERAAEYADRAMEIDGSNTYNLVCHAQVCRCMGREGEARADLDAARLILEDDRATRPPELRTLSLLVDVLIRLGEYGRAGVIVKEAIERAAPGEMHYAYERLGDLLAAQGMSDGALKAWEKALSFMPHYQPARTKLNGVLGCG